VKAFQNKKERKAVQPAAGGLASIANTKKGKSIIMSKREKGGKRTAHLGEKRGVAFEIDHIQGRDSTTTPENPSWKGKKRIKGRRGGSAHKKERPDGFMLKSLTCLNRIKGKRSIPSK